MKKKLVSLVLLTGLTLLGLKLFGALMTYQALESLRDRYGEDLALNYGWLATDLMGSIEISDLHLTSFKLKRSLDVKSATFHFDNLVDLFWGLYELKEGNWQRVRRIVLVPATVSMEGRDPEQWLAETIDPLFDRPLALYACGPHARVGPEELTAMGIKTLTGTFDLHFISRTEVELNLDTDLLGRWSMQVEKTPEQNFALTNIRDWRFQRFELSYVESGYFRRLSNFCSAITQVDRQQFAREASRQWRIGVARAGLLLGAELEQTYARFLTLGGQLNLALTPAQPLRVGDLVAAGNQNLAKLAGLQLSLNGDAVKDPQIFWQRKETKAAVKPTPAPRQVEKRAQREKQWTELALVPENLPPHVGYPLRIGTLDGKTTEARLLEVKTNGLQVARRVQGGEASYFVRFEEVTRLEVYR